LDWPYYISDYEKHNGDECSGGGLKLQYNNFTIFVWLLTKAPKLSKIPVVVSKLFS